MTRGVLALLFMLIASPVVGQIMSPTLRCDVVVNGHTITFPSGWMDLTACKKLQQELINKDVTGAEILCRCQVGNKA